jgi:3'-5' exoribonuclease
LPQFPEALLLHYLDDMDSKMECMRALISNDRQVEGCFTTYNAALERPALKMERYWADAPAAKNGAGVPAASANSGGGKKPEVAPAARPAVAPRSDSPFAGKLKQALTSAPAERES